MQSIWKGKTRLAAIVTVMSKVFFTTIAAQKVGDSFHKKRYRGTYIIHKQRLLQC